MISSRTMRLLNWKEFHICINAINFPFIARLNSYESVWSENKLVMRLNCRFERKSKYSFEDVR